MCWVYGLDLLKTKWEVPSKIAETVRERFLGLPHLNKKQVLINQPDIMIVNKKSVLVTDMAIPSDRKKEGI